LLLLYASPGRLGRFIRNCKTGRKSRDETPADRRLGNAILKQYDTIQEMIDALAHAYRIRRALTRIPNDVWLPEAGGDIIVIHQPEPPTRVSDDEQETATSSRLPSEEVIPQEEFEK
jgi:hypothetical protein